MKKSIKKVKIYTYHNQVQHFDAMVNKKSLLDNIAGLFKGAFKIIFLICYSVGYILVKSFYLLGLILLLFLPKVLCSQSKVSTEEKISDTTSRIIEKLNKLKQPQVKFSLLFFILLLSTQVAFFRSAGLVAFGVNLKEKVINSAMLGAEHIFDAKNHLENEDVSGAQDQLIQALQSFEKSQQEIKDSGLILNQLLNVIPQKRDGEKLIEAAQKATQSGISLADFYSKLKTFKFTPEGISGDEVVNSFESMDLSLSQASTNLEEAAELIKNVNESSVPENYRLVFVEVKQKLTNSNIALNSFKNVFSIAKTLMLGNKNILVMFENNNELRPTGGFMGTYGAFNLSDGKIKVSKISSIYDLDGQLKDHYAPPFPIKVVSPVWYLRDTNWFTDFSESAPKISEYYEKEGGETPDMVIAITPNLVSDLLKITGPITMPAYNVTLDSDNFVEQVQILTSVKYDKNLNKPKQMLADFFPLFLQKLSSGDRQTFLSVLAAFQQNLLSKNIVMYSRDIEMQNKLAAFNWAGEIKQADRDYLLTSFANLNGTKTDLFINQQLDLFSEIGDDGSIVNTLKITKVNTLPEGGQFDNFGFLRIYVPLGSKLLSSRGFSSLKSNLNYDSRDVKADQVVVDWESNASKDLSSETITGQESGKTFFGNWVEVPGSKTTQLEIKYKLPFKLKSLDRLSLLLQKQPGSVRQSFSYNVKFSGKQLEWKNFSPSDLEVNSVKTTLELNKDYFLGMVLSDR